MKHLITISLAVLLFGIQACGQNDSCKQDCVAQCYKLYPTEHMFNFILLDTSNGNTWQVQWSTEPENRGVLEITDIEYPHDCR